MNDELQKQLADYLAAIASSAKAGSQFVIEQAPSVVQEKIAYGRAIETFELVLFIAIAYCGYRCARWGMRDRNYGDSADVAAVFGCIAAGIGLLCSLIQVSYVAQVWLAPRLYIIEWVSGLLAKVAK